MWRELAWSDGSEAHIARHGITPSEVEDVVNSQPRWEHTGMEDSTLIYGRTAAGRGLLVVLVGSADGRRYVATARDLTSSEVRTLRKKGG